MSEFIELPLTKRAISCKKKVYGIGINDADYIVNPIINGKKLSCPYYRIWRDMIRRCYSKKQHEENPSYIGCTVAEEWLTFSNFKRWMKSQDWLGKVLDKDILVIGNKLYSPETCIFVLNHVNVLLTDRANDRGAYPQGVTFEPIRNKYLAQCRRFGKSRLTKQFDRLDDAEKAYRKMKRDEIIRIAEMQNKTKIKQGLYRHAAAYR